MTNFCREINKQQERIAEKEASKRFGLESGEENLPLPERINKIQQQINDIDSMLQRTMNAQEGLNRLISMYETDQQQKTLTLSEINENELKMTELRDTQALLLDLLRQFQLELDSSSPPSSSSSSIISSALSLPLSSAVSIQTTISSPLASPTSVAIASPIALSPCSSPPISSSLPPLL